MNSHNTNTTLGIIPPSTRSHRILLFNEYLTLCPLPIPNAMPMQPCPFLTPHDFVTTERKYHILIHTINPSPNHPVVAGYSPTPNRRCQLPITYPMTAPPFHPYLLQPCLQLLKLAFLDDQSLIIEILDDEVMLVLVDLQDDGFDGGIAFHQDTLQRGSVWLFEEDDVRMVTFDGFWHV